ncbi:hypothetical protein KI387_025532, partial [Taxus chinensis]
ARRILKRKSEHDTDKYSAQSVLVIEDHPEIKCLEDHSGSEVNILVDQRLSRSKHSPAVGHMQIIRPHKQISALKNKLPSGPSHGGVGNAYVNAGGVKSGWRLLKNKLPSGPSRGGVGN